MLPNHPIAAALSTAHTSAIVEGNLDHNELTLFIAPASILDVCRFLKDDQQFNRLSGITAVDWHPADPRFEVVYLLHSIPGNQRIRLKCRVAENQEIESVTGVGRGANWYERETFDMFGVRFANHPDLKRIMMPTDWEGHPLRKDYPVHGHKYSYQSE
jgi:NADH-quinone oxidoreductase subunit C